MIFCTIEDQENLNFTAKIQRDQNKQFCVKIEMFKK